MRGWQVITGTTDDWASPAPRDAAIQSLLPPASAAGTPPPRWAPTPGSAIVSTGVFTGPPVAPSGGPSGASVERTLSTFPSAGSGLLPSNLLPMGGARSLQLEGLAFAPSSGLPPIPERRAMPSGPDLLLQQLQVEAAADGHSSGRSGTASLTAAVKSEPVNRTADHHHPAAACSAYGLRTRSASLREAWLETAASEEARVQAAAEEEEEDEESEDEETASEDSEGAAPRKRVRKPRHPPGKAAARQPGGKPATGKPTHRPAAGKPAPAGKPAVGKAAPKGSSGAAAAAQKSAALRPGVYVGNPDEDCTLSEGERRKLKRRIANRESARRVRAKRSEMMDELQIKVTAQGRHNAELASRLAVAESQNALLVQQSAALQHKLGQKGAQALALYNVLVQLRRHVPAEVMAQAEREAAAATPPPSSPLPGQGSGMFVPLSPHAGAAAGSFSPESAALTSLNYL